MKGVEAYPLHWPDGYSRTKNPESSRFKTSFTVARDELFEEVRRLGGVLPVLSTNIELRRDGLPYANRRQPEDAGAALYFQLRGKPKTFACDAWEKVGDNIQAIRKTLEALRGIERWRVAEIEDRVYSGFDYLPDKSQGAWWAVLGVSQDATQTEVDSAYKKLRSEHHPDKGGGAQEFQRIQDAYKEWLEL